MFKILGTLLIVAALAVAAFAIPGREGGGIRPAMSTGSK